MTSEFVLSKERIFSKVEQQMIWRKPATHQTSAEELRIAHEIASHWHEPELRITNILLEGDAGSGKTELTKGLSAALQLPYTKVTCFADMDKSDVFGALLPIVSSDSEEENDLLQAIYQTDSLSAVLKLIETHFAIPENQARQRLADFIQHLESGSNEEVQYKFYPSEIVRAIQKGYLLEIQEPTVIRDASVLVALNSALEPDGMLNLPTGLIQRHHDTVIVVTTNRNYQGNRPLNESLRDRMQHAEKMDLPSLAVMTARASAKIGYQQEEVLYKMAEIIRLLDQTAKSNAIKGVAGMRSYFYWVDTVKRNQNPLETIFSKVLYKLTTNEDELTLLQQQLTDSHLLNDLHQLLTAAPLKQFKHVQQASGRKIGAEEANERHIPLSDEPANDAVHNQERLETEQEEPASVQQPVLKNNQPESIPDFDNSERSDNQNQPVSAGDLVDDTAPKESAAEIASLNQQDQEIKRAINKDARALLKGNGLEPSIIIHRPTLTAANIDAVNSMKQEIIAPVRELSKQIMALLEKEKAVDAQKGRYDGQRFNASRVSYGDYKYFDKQLPPHEQPSLALAVRVDESGSMIRENRILHAQKAALAISAFAQQLEVPLLLYGDTADVQPRERTSIYSYKEFFEEHEYLDSKIMTMKPRQNNRDGVVLRIMAEKLSKETATTKLLINISDGQPKALPDYSGELAKHDIQDVLQEYERQGIIFVAAAIGQDKEVIKAIYGENRFIDISDLNQLPVQMLQLIARYL